MGFYVSQCYGSVVRFVWINFCKQHFSNQCLIFETHYSHERRQRRAIVWALSHILTTAYITVCVWKNGVHTVTKGHTFVRNKHKAGVILHAAKWKKHPPTNTPSTTGFYQFIFPMPDKQRWNNKLWESWSLGARCRAALTYQQEE